MAFFTPESFDLMLNEIEKKTDEERHETIINNMKTILVSYEQNFQNGNQLGALVVMSGLKAAFCDLEDIPPQKFNIGKELYELITDIESENELKENMQGYSENVEGILCKLISAFNNNELQRCVFEYMLALAVYGQTNPTGIDTIRRVFNTLF